MQKETKAFLTDVAVFDFESASNDELYDTATLWAATAQNLLRAALRRSASVLVVEVEHGLVVAVYGSDPFVVVADFDVDGNVPKNAGQAREEGYLEVDGVYAHVYTMETAQEMRSELRRAVTDVAGHQG